MIISFYKKFFVLLLTTLIYINLFIVVKDVVIVSIYPYLLGITVLFSLLLFITQIFQNTIIINIIYTLMTIIFIFFVFTFFQICRNTGMLNGYQVKRSKYMDQLMEITEKENKTDTHLLSVQSQTSQLVESNTGIPITFHNEAKFLYNGTSIFDEMIEEIEKAKHHIHIEFFIFRDDNIGHKFKKLLIDKVKEGVKVRIIYDGLGSSSLKKSFRDELIKSGVELKPYNTLWQSIVKGKLNHRNHRKIVIIDGIVGFTGGVNIGDEYLGRDNTIGNWKDVLIKIKGESVNWMQKIFLGDWYYVSGEKILDKNYFPKWEVDNILPIQIVNGGYDTHWNEISQVYFNMITTAQEKLYIVTPYLVLSDSMIKALQTAALKGVDVKIIIPKKPDLFLVGWANASFFDRLLNSKVKIYLYEDGFLHSKILVADHNIVSVGSGNLNNRSQYLDYEMNAILYDSQQSQDIIEEIYKNIENSQEVILEEHKDRSIVERFKEKIGMFMIPLI